MIKMYKITSAFLSVANCALILTFLESVGDALSLSFCPQRRCHSASHVTESNKSYNGGQNRVRRSVLTGFFICISLSSAIIVPDWQRYDVIVIE